jgi:hypothetical protein
MAISIALTPDQERKLEGLAGHTGKDPSSYAKSVLVACLDGGSSRGGKKFKEMLAPVWEGWRQSGMTEDEIDDLFAKELQAVRRERRQHKGPA